MDLNLKFSVIQKFLAANPDFRPNLVADKQALDFNTDDYNTKLFNKFVNGRIINRPKLSNTVPDPAIGIVLRHGFGFDEDFIGEADLAHKVAMTSENYIGRALELYIAGELESKGLIWCSGEVTKSIDFIIEKDDGWVALQVKNKNTTENSSSKKVRDGTEVIKWFRIFSNKAGDNWSNFPDVGLDTSNLSETNFHSFLAQNLQRN